MACYFYGSRERSSSSQSRACFTCQAQRERSLDNYSHRHARSTGLHTHLPPHHGCHHWIRNHVRSMHGAPIRQSDGVYFSGSAPVAFVAMLGPRFGLRTMVITRYSFGYSGAAVISILNIMTQVRCRRPRPLPMGKVYTSVLHLLSCDVI